MEKGIVDMLGRILFGIRVGSVVGLLALFWFTPMPWKAIIMLPFVAPPLIHVVLVWIEKLEQAEIDASVASAM